MLSVLVNGIHVVSRGTILTELTHGAAGADGELFCREFVGVFGRDDDLSFVLVLSRALDELLAFGVGEWFITSVAELVIITADVAGELGGAVIAAAIDMVVHQSVPQSSSKIDGSSPVASSSVSSSEGSL